MGCGLDTTDSVQCVDEGQIWWLTRPGNGVAVEEGSSGARFYQLISRQIGRRYGRKQR